MKTTDIPAFIDRLQSALTQYDAKQCGKRSYNPHALGIYFARAEDIRQDIANGADPRAALCAGMTGPVLAFVLRSLGMSAPSDRERAGSGSWCYEPAAKL